MRKLLFFICAIIAFAACNQKGKEQNNKPVTKTNENPEYTLTKDGIGDLKIGLKQDEVEKLLNQQLHFQSMKDSDGYWSDTVHVKYKNIDVDLFFERLGDENDNTYMQVSGMETKSPLCKTATGLGVGDDKASILAAYDNSPIDMGPAYEQINDTTWRSSPTKFNVNIKDTSYDKQIVFHLLNKKTVSVEASYLMEE